MTKVQRGSGRRDGEIDADIDTLGRCSLTGAIWTGGVTSWNKTA